MFVCECVVCVPVCGAHSRLIMLSFIQSFNVLCMFLSVRCTCTVHSPFFLDDTRWNRHIKTLGAYATLLYKQARPFSVSLSPLSFCPMIHFMSLSEASSLSVSQRVDRVFYNSVIIKTLRSCTKTLCVSFLFCCPTIQDCCCCCCCRR